MAVYITFSVRPLKAVGHHKATMTYGLYIGGTSTQQKFDAVESIEYKK